MFFVFANFRDHESSRAFTIAHLQTLARTQFIHIVSAKCFHMHEDIRRTITLSDETIPSSAVKPFNTYMFKLARWDDIMMGHTITHTRSIFGNNRRAAVHANKFNCLQSFWPMNNFTHNSRTFMRRVMPSLL